MPDKKVRVAIVGLGFGAEFIPIYQRHPDAEMYAICRRDKAELDACGDRFGIDVALMLLSLLCLGAAALSSTIEESGVRPVSESPMSSAASAKVALQAEAQ